MLEKMESTSTESLMASQVNMMIMRQLDAMNRSMDRREREERREKRKKRERRKRRVQRVRPVSYTHLTLPTKA